MKNTAMAEKPVFRPNPKKLLNVAMKYVELKAEVIESDNQVNLYGGKIGDYIVILPAGVCFILNKATFETIWQTTPAFCKCEAAEEKEEA